MGGSQPLGNADARSCAGIVDQLVYHHSTLQRGRTLVGTLEDGQDTIVDSILLLL